MSKKEVLVFAGTRPEIIKVAPVVAELRARRAAVHFCFTGQHVELAMPFIKFFGIAPDSQLELMSPGQSLGQLTARAAAQMDTFLAARSGAGAALVQGDTTTAFVAALSAFYHGIPVGHVEAGLRTASIREPFPEELNRRLITRVAAWHYAPTQASYDTLLAERVPPASALITGNTGIDAFLYAIAHTREPSRRELLALDGKRLVLVTAHRRENIGEPLRNITAALARLAKTNPDVNFVLPVHKNPKIVETVQANLSGIPNFLLTDPLEYGDLVWVMKRAELIMSDSGGIQEEAPSLLKPVLVLRNETERPEAVEYGTSIIVGSDQDTIVLTAQDFLSGRRKLKMKPGPNPYGAGEAARKIADHLLASI